MERPGAHPSCIVRWQPSPPWSPVPSARAAVGGRGLQYIPPYLVDVIHALHLELSQPWHIQLPAAIRAQSDLQLLLRLFPQQVPGAASETLLLPSHSGLRLPRTQSLAWNLPLHPAWTTGCWPLLLIQFLPCTQKRDNRLLQKSRGSTASDWVGPHPYPVQCSPQHGKES